VGHEDLRYAVRDTTGAWSIETVDSANRVGYDTAIAVDANGGVHIRYYDLTMRAIRYAHRAPLGTFTFSTIAQNVDAEGIANLTVDASANLRTAYYDSVGRALRFARFSGGQWSTETIVQGPATTPSAVGEWNGTLYVSYADAVARTVNVAVRDPVLGTWSSQTVEAGLATANTALDVDAQGVVHVAYFNAAARTAKHAWQNGAGWTTEAIGTAQGSSINLRADVDLHVSFSGLATVGSSLDYAKSSTGGWMNEVIDRDNQVGVYPTIRVDSTGIIQVSHGDAVNQNVRHTYRKPGGVWTTFKLSDSLGPANMPGDTSNKAVAMTTDGAGAYAVCYCDALRQFGCSTAPSVDAVWAHANLGSGGCGSAALVRDPAGPIHLVYDGFSALDHATAASLGATWSAPDTIGSTFAKDGRIATDGAGGEHVVYIDSLSGDIRHAYRAAAGPGWVLDTIEGSSSNSLQSAIALDASGRIHAVYRKGTALRHASRAMSDVTWSIETIDPSCEDGEVSIGFEPNGAMHVVYFDSTPFALAMLGYAFKCAGGAWTSNPLQVSSPFGFASLAIAGGTLHVAYFGAGLIYASIPSACQ
jgi:hypothetical protein